MLLTSAASDSRAQLFSLDNSPGEDEEGAEDGGVDARQRALRRWEQIKDIYDRRVARMHEDRLLARKLTQDLMQLRDWMKGLERRLSRPVVMHDSSEKEYRKKRKEYLVRERRLFSSQTLPSIANSFSPPLGP